MPYKDPEKQAAWQREHYLENKELFAKRNRASKRKMHEEYRRLKSGPCQDCKITYPPYVMQFDHVKGKKIAGVSVLTRTASLAAVLAEVKKCDLLCANCHAIRTWERKMKKSTGYTFSDD